MTKYILLFTFLLGTVWLSAQQNHEQEMYSKVRINLIGKDIRQLARLGLEVDHGHLHPGKFLENDYSLGELQQITDAGFEYEVIIEDVVAWYQDRNRQALEIRGEQNCGGSQGGVTDFPVPENFEYGSMGGFLTYQEMLGNLDAMRTQYPDLISEKAPIEGFETIEGRPIYWLQISDNPDQEEAGEEQIFYNAVHHAREAASLAQLIYYMWYLLENYETNDEVKFLVDNTAMYFVPCINPDGYIYNETIAPNGGGLWRKNRRQNADGSYGVDLNRNYGYEWGYDDIGSSTDPSSNTYRGTAGFSEPETAAIKSFCEAHNFKITLNYHSYGNLLIYPWGYSDQLTADSTLFKNMAAAMSRENNFFAGTGSQTVGYTVNGDSDDWMYGDRNIFSYTPEVGTTGFWPTQPEIIPICKTTTLQNLTAAWLLHGVGILSRGEVKDLSTLNGFCHYNIQHYGLNSADVTVSLSPITSNVVAVGSQANYTLDDLENIQDSISYELSPSIGVGELVKIEIAVDNQSVITKDTISFVFNSEGDVEFEDDLTTGGAWTTSGTWEVTPNEYYSAPTSMTDSYGTSYDDNQTNSITQQEPVLIDGEVVTANLTFYAKWDIETGWDYVGVALLKNDEDPQYLCGQYTKNGNSNQLEGEPIYDGTQSEWVAETIDLTGLIEDGDNVRFMYVLVSDQAISADGFYFDDVKLNITYEGAVNTQNIALNQWDVEVAPNPTSDRISIKSNGVAENTTMVIVDVLGRQIVQRDLLSMDTVIDVENWNKGVYFLQLKQGGYVVDVKKIIVE